ncbi:MAG: VOC family protein [Kofleriaceae bacterium]
MVLAQALVFVHDAAKMQAFYEALGLRVMDGSAAEGFVRLADPAGGAVLALHHTRAIGPGGPPRTDAATKLGFHVDDVAAARATLVAQGVTMRELFEHEGVAFCDGIDPEGNIFQLTSRR